MQATNNLSHKDQPQGETAMTALKTFDNSQLGQIRTVLRDGEPWFVAKDIAACIGHSDTSAMCKLCRVFYAKQNTAKVQSKMPQFCPCQKSECRFM